MNACMFTYTLVQLCSWYDLIITTFVVANQCYTKCAWIKFKHSHIHTRERALNKERNREEKTSSKNTAQRLLAQSALLTCSRSQWLSEFALTFTHTHEHSWDWEREICHTTAIRVILYNRVRVCLITIYFWLIRRARSQRAMKKFVALLCAKLFKPCPAVFNSSYYYLQSVFFLLLYSHYKRDATSR